jgi:colanic acid biosynthesis protein WcaH
MITITEAISFLDTLTPNKAASLPDEIFYFVSRLTPLMCIDLLVKDKNGRILLSWRDDKLFGKGWHIPGGILRFKETIQERIQRIAVQELRTNKVQFDIEPIRIEQQIIAEHENRGHQVVFVYKCRVPEDYILDNSSKNPADAGYLQWHDCCPVNLIENQNYYRSFIDKV